MNRLRRLLHRQEHHRIRVLLKGGASFDANLSEITITSREIKWTNYTTRDRLVTVHFEDISAVVQLS